MKMGGVELHQLLKNLCVNTEWKYAVFWKLKHQTPMMMTWEDAYCDDNDRLRSNWFDNTNHNSNAEEYAHDLLELAVARMSYRVYSIGEGVVGCVAVTGKHQWISGDQLVNSSCSSDEHFDGWKMQFTAGIRTILVVDVVPHGVVQLGSLKTIAEDLKLVNQIREIFFELKSSSMESADCSPCVTDVSTSLGSDRFRKHLNNHNRQEIEYPISNFIRSAPFNDQNENLFMLETSNLEFETEANELESFKFPAGCELYEALGPSFCKQQNSFDWEMATTATVTNDEMTRETSGRSLLNQTSVSDHLLEAVVGNVCSSDNGSTSFGQSVNSLRWLQPPPSDDCSRGVLSTSVSRISEQLERSREPAKVGKKRARPGESCKPRPRDRQLIQDRIKELRQLVPNGSKCSIDSLLERTIKHMVFMQCMTKHADKIDKCAEFKLLGKELGVQGSNGHEQGSSWAMEVGDHLKLCPIIVENIGVDGQMLVEMMCDEYVHFLEITEAIRSLGLTILKGVNDAHGDKTWMCFIVEGENNKSVHRMDILWSLVQILQSKTKG